MAVIEDNLHVIGYFHLGQEYDLSRWQGKPSTQAFDCSEQSETEPSKSFKRIIVITKGAFLLFEPTGQ
jgi:hypothetical protein